MYEKESAIIIAEDMRFDNNILKGHPERYW